MERKKNLTTKVAAKDVARTEESRCRQNDLNRREFLATTAAITGSIGASTLGFTMVAHGFPSRKLIG